MAIGIFGLPQSGKTTIFNAVTKGHAETASFKSSGARPNVGVAKVPDFRLEDLASISNPKKIIYAEISSLCKKFTKIIEVSPKFKIINIPNTLFWRLFLIHS